MRNTYYWMNKETGELLTYKQMMEEAREMYDLDDTNVCGRDEYYELTKVRVG